jgi:hypothetical protein
MPINQYKFIAVHAFCAKKIMNKAYILACRNVENLKNTIIMPIVCETGYPLHVNCAESLKCVCILAGVTTL